MNESQLKLIESRLIAATKGPWKSFVEGRDHESGSNFIQTSADDIELIGATIADQDFIANCRVDAELLIREIRQLKGLP